MSVKLEEKYLKKKIKSIYGTIEVYNPLDNKIYSELSNMIANNSIQVENDGKSDIQINNTIDVMRFMLIHLTNIENEDFWSNISDFDLEVMLNQADGDFKKTISDLMDIMIEIGIDNRRNANRQLDILQESVNELVKVLDFNNNLDKSLGKLGLNKELLIKVARGDEDAKNEFEKQLFNNKINKNRKVKNKKK
ncbi:hypothetical protein [Clostridium botulinum]|uniref:hypothetical protein n=1 Tax=Clostridium botulinum TaxID=1491 RepID=UPI001C9A94EC|nr:hypothetical protein [Clostridium botulinum]MBY6838851.1 hypothetical protein [Clostridium botulinum]